MIAGNLMDKIKEFVINPTKENYLLMQREMLLSEDGVSIQLEDPSTTKSVLATVKGTDKGIGIAIEGYGNNEMEDGYGEPIYLEHYDDDIVIRVWDDINQSGDPSHRISLKNARESNRNER